MSGSRSDEEIGEVQPRVHGSTLDYSFARPVLARLGAMGRAEHVCSARVIQTSTCSAMARASSTSMPRDRTVLSIFV